MSANAVASYPVPMLGDAGNRSRWWLLLLPALFVAVRCAYAPLMELYADEAYYWVWSRHPQMGYFDHSPMVAWLISLSTALLGTSEIAVRLPAILAAGGTVLAGAWLASALGGSLRAMLLTQVMLAIYPIVQVDGAIITPDSPALLFIMLAVAAGVSCGKRPAHWGPWLLLGLLAGAAMLSKYMAIFPMLTLYLCLLVWQPRRWPAVILSGLIASAVVSPMLFWNYQNDFISFRFQLAHGMGKDQREWFVNVGEYIGSQILLATPVLFPLLLWAAWRAIRRGPADQRTVALAASSLLVFFLYSSFRHKVEANWPTLVWPVLVVLLALKADGGADKLRQWVRSGLIVALVATLVLMLPPALMARFAPKSPLAKTGGWEQLAHTIQHMAEPGLPIIATSYQDAALFAFYLPGRPEVSVLREAKDRPSQFDLWPAPAIRPGDRFLLLMDYKPPVGPLKMVDGHQELDLEVLSSKTAQCPVDGLQTRTRAIALCRRLDAAP